MASLQQRLTAFAQRMQAQYNNKIAPRLLPPGGGGGMMLIRASDDPWNNGWAIPPQGMPSPHYCSVYMDANTGGGINNADNPASYGGTTGFNRFLFDHATRDDEGLWDRTNNWYTVPQTGLYLITAMMRLPDGLNNTWFGIGVDNIQTDNENFLWSARFAGPTQWGIQYARLRYLTAGMQMRMFGYTILFKPARATMEFAMISKPL